MLRDRQVLGEYLTLKKVYYKDTKVSLYSDQAIYHMIADKFFLEASTVQRKVWEMQKDN